MAAEYKIPRHMRSPMASHSSENNRVQAVIQ
jgi:hypothetical protein